MSGRWVIPNHRSAVEAFLTHSTRRPLRERAWRAWNLRGDRLGERNNHAVAAQILALRAERSRLLGFDSYADWKLTDMMAGRPAVALELVTRVWPALAEARKQLAAMQELADADRTVFAAGGSDTIEPWDVLHYRDKLRRATNRVDETELAPYLQLDRVRDAMFWAAGRLTGLRFRPARDVPVFHPDAAVFEVLWRDGRFVGLTYHDPFSRPGKNSGVWARVYRLQQRLVGDLRPVVALNTNFRPGQAGSPVSMSWREAVDLFHEFGHVLHALMATPPIRASPRR